MRLQRKNDTFHFLLNTLESRLLARVFEQLVSQYKLKPEDLDPKTASAWYSTRGCRAANLSDRETHEWLDQIHALKGANVERLKKWSKQIKSSPSSLRVQANEASTFINAVNDHRLAAAALHDIGQREMDLQSPLQLVTLPPNQQEALLEIHLLAWIIEETLRALGDWNTLETPGEI